MAITKVTNKLIDLSSDKTGSLTAPGRGLNLKSFWQDLGVIDSITEIDIFQAYYNEASTPPIADQISYVELNFNKSTTGPIDLRVQFYSALTQEEKDGMTAEGCLIQITGKGYNQPTSWTTVFKTVGPLQFAGNDAVYLTVYYDSGDTFFNGNYNVGNSIYLYPTNQDQPVSAVSFYSSSFEVLFNKNIGESILKGDRISINGVRKEETTLTITEPLYIDVYLDSAEGGGYIYFMSPACSLPAEFYQAFDSANTKPSKIYINGTEYAFEWNNEDAAPGGDSCFVGGGFLSVTPALPEGQYTIDPLIDPVLVTFSVDILAGSNLTKNELNEKLGVCKADFLNEMSVGDIIESSIDNQYINFYDSDNNPAGSINVNTFKNTTDLPNVSGLISKKNNLIAGIDLDKETLDNYNVKGFYIDSSYPSLKNSNNEQELLSVVGIGHSIGNEGFSGIIIGENANVGYYVPGGGNVSGISIGINSRAQGGKNISIGNNIFTGDETNSAGSILLGNNIPGFNYTDASIIIKPDDPTGLNRGFQIPTTVIGHKWSGDTESIPPGQVRQIGHGKNQGAQYNAIGGEWSYNLYEFTRNYQGSSIFRGTFFIKATMIINFTDSSGAILSNLWTVGESEYVINFSNSVSPSWTTNLIDTSYKTGSVPNVTFNLNDPYSSGELQCIITNNSSYYARASVYLEIKSSLNYPS